MENLLQNALYFVDKVSEDSVRACLERIQECLQDRKKPTSITIVLSTLGGEIEPAFALFDLIRMSSVPIFIIASGEVGSIGTLIFLSVPKERRFITQNAHLFFHAFGVDEKHGTVVVGGKGFSKLPKDERKGLELSQEKYVRIISEETTLKKKKIIKMLNKETYLTPKKAIKCEFAGKII